jgi:Protein of unknown function (DUF2958)
VQQLLHPKPKETTMELLTHEKHAQMLADGCTNAGREQTGNFQPVVKLYCSWNLAIWLLTELDPENPDIAFGLCDLGQGFPELGNVSLSELASIEGVNGVSY